MRIGKLAKQAGISVDTARYYEKVGLLPQPPRRPNGYRSYDKSHLERLAFVRHCRALDLSLEDIRRLLGLVTNPEADCAALDHMIDDQLTRVREQIATLQALEQQLKMLRSRCTMQASVGKCGILQDLLYAARGEGCVHLADSADTPDQSGLDPLQQ
jgi:Cd(II)/Pb(II)-responsive transcriptional regulator